MFLGSFVVYDFACVWTPCMKNWSFIENLSQSRGNFGSDRRKFDFWLSILKNQELLGFFKIQRRLIEDFSLGSWAMREKS